jgi:hypothetical protein
LNFYFWNAENAQKDSWQTIRPREYFVFPREGNEVSDARTGYPEMVHKIFKHAGWLQVPRKPGHSMKRGALTRSPRATHFLNCRGHSRTLYTSNALEQSNFII